MANSTGSRRRAHHPSTLCRVFRMDVMCSGPWSGWRELKPVFGYLHRNHAKIPEGTSYLASITTLDRQQLFPVHGNRRLGVYAGGAEAGRAAGAWNARDTSGVITAGTDPLAESRLSRAGFSVHRTWRASVRRVMYAFRETGKILDLLESLTDAQMMCNIALLAVVGV